MKKLIYIAAFLVAAAACNSHNGESKTESEATGVMDTTAVADSLQPGATDTVQKADSVKELAAAKPESENKEKAVEKCQEN